MTKNHYDKQAYNPQFEWSFVHPRYWGTWLAVMIASLLSLLPHNVRRSLATVFAKQAIKLKSGANHRARVNLKMCFPEKSEAEREQILLQNLITAGSFLSGFAALSVRNKTWLEQHTIIRGMENLTSLTEQQQSVILLVPHTWAIDIPAVLLASRGLPVSAMAKKQKNPVSDWLMHRQRVQYGGRVYERSGGIKPFIKSVREGYLGYYLPDEDLGPEHSVFVDFFGTTKATMAGLGRLSKLSRAKIVPLFAMYNSETGMYELDFYPALPFPAETEEQDARMMNQCIEQYVNQRPEQYMWILRLLKTRQNSDENPYAKR
ncbi:lauroyl acyltransferase [Photobacterium kishitanii]|uniref:Lipid A biosynthesis acyltransferase n=1 Tax=Photobacterium kishitanii TaxID=318456 RepID=A0AAX0YU69_9GAMM|nr:lauroyl-Kdo(2)-lipid IV(A) myristoyltransferase [Photobacterium kishitanii]KJG09605.1 lauroyl acyltransferase [Photobacterium kishitanii]KJG58101.1 lauroyl acyltransferase [Photobacterium kishitanii]KJG61617.1 lauroyl acyltransferase [Photobacterium kishitanii]KJG65915.1 lauroyl acyltransferase [Photobacterium kishitanii]OBU34213.1 lipid A biosynthesis (KDO)2-(lauroyl)-lipid IVA acyltransferase [Photobacterium kishitanii]